MSWELLAVPLATAWGTIVPIAVGVVLVLWAVGAYNKLVRLKNLADEKWADIETELKRRYNLIPNLVETVKGYASHEKETLEAVMKARNAAASPHASPADQARDDNFLSGALRQLFAVVENYPDLKANTNFLELQQELSDTENRIQRSRSVYNDNVRDLNTRIEMFPSNVIAGLFGFDKKDFFEIEDPAAREVPKVEF